MQNKKDKNLKFRPLKSLDFLHTPNTSNSPTTFNSLLPNCQVFPTTSTIIN